MNLKLFLLIQAIIAAAFGLLDLLAPATSAALNQIAADGLALEITRLVGASLLATAVLSFLLRDAHLSFGRRAGLAYLTAANGLFAFLLARLTLNGIMGAGPGWGNSTLMCSIDNGFRLLSLTGDERLKRAGNSF